MSKATISPITRKWCEIELKSVLFTNRKSYTGFRSVPKPVTTSDFERINGRHYPLFHTIRQLPELASNSLNIYRPIVSDKIVARRVQYLAIHGLWRTTCATSAVAEFLVSMTIDTQTSFNTLHWTGRMDLRTVVITSERKCRDN